MKTIAICNHKGGVGKTALSMAIAEGLHRKGKRTLLVDLDQHAFCVLVSHFLKMSKTGIIKLTPVQ